VTQDDERIIHVWLKKLVKKLGYSRELIQRSPSTWVFGLGDLHIQVPFMDIGVGRPGIPMGSVRVIYPSARLNAQENRPHSVFQDGTFLLQEDFLLSDPDVVAKIIQTVRGG
jgi:hypothetical protein